MIFKEQIPTLPLFHQVFKTKSSKISTVVLRGGNANSLDEWERALTNGIHVARVCSKDGKFCAGGGAAEIQVARKLKEFGQTVPGLDQYAVLKFAEALEIVAKILSDNCGKKGRVETLTGVVAAQESVGRGQTAVHGGTVFTGETGVQ